MVPIRNFSDISTFMKCDIGLIEAPFYIMALYKSEHKEYRQFILSEFIKIHHQTQDISFIVCDQPPDGWKEREDAQYYERLVGDDYKPQLNDFEIEVICDYMEIPVEALPCIVCFASISKYSFNTFSFAKSSISEVTEFFNSLLEKTAKFSYQEMSFVDVMIQLRKEFKKCNVFARYDKHNIIQSRLENANNQIKSYPLREGQIFIEKPLRKLTPLQIVRQSCQAKAQQMWKKNPSMTIEALVHDPDFLSCFEGTTIQRKKTRTLREWVKEFCPDRSPGRRANS